MSLHDMKSVIPVLYTNYKFNAGVKPSDIGVNDVQFEVLKKLCVLLMETKFTNEASKLYMQNAEYTQEDVATELGLASKNTAKGRIRYDNQKFLGLYQTDIYSAILNTEDELALNNIDRVLSNALNTSPRISRNAVDYVCVSLPRKPEVYSTVVSDAEFSEYKDLIYSISNKHVEDVISRLGDKGLGYIEYLLDSDPINNLDIKRRTELLSILSGDNSLET